jgi:bifunctional non-homologous end joining protein LigD
VRRPQPFSDPDWIFEIKYDGFRALAYLDGSGARLISRNGNRFASFDFLCQSIAFFLRAKDAVLDGEIVCLDNKGHSQFNELLFHRGTPRFCAFDVLSLNGRDLRHRPLIERKRLLRTLVTKDCLEILYVDHLERNGEGLFELTCERDLEGIVAKHRQSRYSEENGNPAWIKIKNRNYSQIIGRNELFDREERVTGWASCEKACAAAAS